MFEAAETTVEEVADLAAKFRVAIAGEAEEFALPPGSPERLKQSGGLCSLARAVNPLNGNQQSHNIAFPLDAERFVCIRYSTYTSSRPE